MCNWFKNHLKIKACAKKFFWTLLGFKYSQYMDKLLKKNKQRKEKTPEWTSKNETEGPIRGAAQIENRIKKSKKYKNYISMWTMSGGKCTILQVTKCTGIPHQILHAKGSSEFVLKNY